MPKISDIKKFTRIGNYQVNVGWDGLKDNLERYQQDHGLELCPDFQRGHVWSREQQIAYVEYKLRGGAGTDTIYLNCVGWMNEFEGPFVLVDGLQRITAALAFLDNEIPAFGHKLKQYEDGWRLLHTVDFIFNINNLKTRAEVLQWYIEMNGGGVVHSKEELDRVRSLLEKEND